jgi:hypothetical protein
VGGNKNSVVVAFTDGGEEKRRIVQSGQRGTDKD